NRLFSLLHLFNAIITDGRLTNFALFLQLRNSFHRFRDRSGRIGPVDLVEIDIVGSEAPEAIFTFLDHAFLSGISVDVNIVAFIIFGREGKFALLGIPAVAVFSKNLELIARDIADRFTNDFLAVSLSIDGRRMDGRYAVILCGMYCFCGIIFLRSAPQPSAKRPGTEGYNIKLQVSIAKCAVNHNGMVLNNCYWLYQVSKMHNAYTTFQYIKNEREE